MKMSSYLKKTKAVMKFSERTQTEYKVQKKDAPDDVEDANDVHDDIQEDIQDISIKEHCFEFQNKNIDFFA